VVKENQKNLENINIKNLEVNLIKNLKNLKNLKEIKGDNYFNIFFNIKKYYFHILYSYDKKYKNKK